MINQKTFTFINALSPYKTLAVTGQQLISEFNDFLNLENFKDLVSNLKIEDGELHCRLIGCDLVVIPEIRFVGNSIPQNGYLTTYIKLPDGKIGMDIYTTIFDKYGSMGGGFTMGQNQNEYFFGNYYFGELVNGLRVTMFAPEMRIPLKF